MRDYLNLAIVRTEEMTLQPEGYRLFVRPERGRFRCWIAGVAWRFLHWMQCLQPYFHKTVTYRYEKPERDKVTAMVVAQVAEVMARGGDPDHYCLVLGGVQFSEVLRDYVGDKAEYVTIPAGTVYHILPGGYRGELRGFKVHVVPHLDGVALIPKVLVETLYDPLTRRAI